MITKHLLTPEEKIEAWGEGEWVNEPELVEFDHLGYKCRIKRMSVIEGFKPQLTMGYLCGYVGIPKNHPCSGNTWEESDFDCHGGQTYGREDDDGLFWIGFDCAHSFDMIPSMQTIHKEIENDILEMWPDIPSIHSVFQRTYKNIEFVIEECKKLAKQLKEKK